MGTVCAMMLAAGNHPVTIWGAFEATVQRLQQTRENARLLPGVKIPDSVRLTSVERDAFGEGASACTMVLCAVPTQYIRQTVSRVASFLPEGIPIVSVSKGIERETLLRPTQVLQQVCGEDRPVAVLSGPNIAAELARYLPGSAVAASEDQILARRVQVAMTTQWFRVYTNIDLLGVEISGAIKNVIALAAGMLDGLGAGNNAKAALLTRGLVEISRLGAAMGASASTFQGLAGLGDLVTTCVSPEGRNRQVGELLGRGKKLDDILRDMSSVAEGVHTTAAVRQLAESYGVEMPIVNQVYEVLFGQKDPIQALADLMGRGLKSES